MLRVILVSDVLICLLDQLKRMKSINCYAMVLQYHPTFSISRLGYEMVLNWESLPYLFCFMIQSLSFSIHTSLRLCFEQISCSSIDPTEEESNNLICPYLGAYSMSMWHKLIYRAAQFMQVIRLSLSADRYQYSNYITF